MTTAVLLALVALALLGLPLFVAVGAAALWLFHAEGMDLQVVAIEMNRLASMPILVALPLFTFTGTLLARGSGPQRLVDLARTLMGWLPGGVALVTLVVCAAFTAFTGASGVTIVALGGLLFPLLRSSGASERFALGMLTTGGSFGLLFPPSLAVILYAVVARVPIGDLYKASLIPGLVMLGMLGAYAVLRGQSGRRDDGGEAAPPLAPPPPLPQALRAAAWDLPLPIVVVGGIYLGYLTVVEASTLAAAWVTVVQVGILRQVHWRSELPQVVRESMSLVGAVLLILAVAQGLTNYLIDIQLPEAMFELVSPWLTSRLAFLMALNVFLLMVGCMMDLFSAVVVVVPLLLPLAEQYQVDPLHLGVIFLANLELGYATPPVGLNLFIASLRFRRPLWSLYVAALPFLALLIAAVLLITWFPSLSLWWR